MDISYILGGAKSLFVYFLSSHAAWGVSVPDQGLKQGQDNEGTES